MSLMKSYQVVIVVKKVREVILLVPEKASLDLVTRIPGALLVHAIIKKNRCTESLLPLFFLSIAVSLCL
jgi:hypothetical protein